MIEITISGLTAEDIKTQALDYAASFATAEVPKKATKPKAEPVAETVLLEPEPVIVAEEEATTDTEVTLEDVREAAGRLTALGSKGADAFKSILKDGYGVKKISDLVPAAAYGSAVADINAAIAELSE